MLWVVSCRAHTQVSMYSALGELKPGRTTGEKLGAEWPTELSSVG